MIGFLSPKGLALLKPMAIPLAFLAWTWVCFFSVVAFVAALKHYCSVTGAGASASAGSGAGAGVGAGL